VWTSSWCTTFNWNICRNCVCLTECRGLITRYRPSWPSFFLTPLSWVLLEKLPFPQLLKGFAIYYGTRKFISVHKSPPLVPIPSEISPVHSAPPISPIIILSPLSLLLEDKSRLMGSPCCLCVSESHPLTFAFLNQSLWNSYVYHGNRAHLNGVLHKSLPSVCVFVCVCC
jgi:hypothetical protein